MTRGDTDAFLWHDRDAEVLLVLEVSRGCPRARSIPCPVLGGDFSARAASGPAPRPGRMGGRCAGGREWLRSGHPGRAGARRRGAAGFAARLREFLYDGADRAAPCAISLEVEACFAPLLAWVVRWWVGDTLPLAIDATTLRGRQVVLSVSVLYRGSAIPVAWVVMPHRGKGAWIPELQRLLALLAPAVPATLTVLVLTDRGLWSPRLWYQIVACGWHPLMRIRPDATFTPAGARRQHAHELLPGPGWCWVGAGVAFKEKAKQLSATLVVVWGAGQREPWLLLTDLPPEAVDGSWYGLRVWIELGFRALKSLGFHWERTRRTHPTRIARHWLVLAIATLLSLAVGTRLEDAAEAGIPPGHLRRPRTATPAPARARRQSLFRQGRARVHAWVWRGTAWWRALWLWPEAWPTRSEALTLIRHQSPPAPADT